MSEVCLRWSWNRASRCLRCYALVVVVALVLLGPLGMVSDWRITLANEPPGAAIQGQPEPRKPEPKPVTLSGQHGPLHSVAFSRDGRMLASGSSFLWLGGAEFSGGDLRLWDTKTGKKIDFAGTLPPEAQPRLRESAGNFRSVRFSPNGRLLAAGMGRFELTGSKWSGLIVIWDVQSGKQQAVLRGHSDEVLAIEFSPNGRLLASGSKDSTIKLWDVKTGQELATLKGQEATPFTFSSDSQTLASVGGKSVKVWDANTGKEKAAFGVPTGADTALAFSPDGHTLVSGGSTDSAVRLWEVKTGKLKATLKGHQGPIRSVAFSADGRRLASTAGKWSRLQPRDVGGQGEIKLWDVESAKEIATLEKYHEMFSCVAFSTDGRRLAAGNMDGSIKLWNLPE